MSFVDENEIKSLIFTPTLAAIIITNVKLMVVNQTVRRYPIYAKKPFHAKKPDNLRNSQKIENIFQKQR
jgi:hypothetical protein